MGTGNLRDRVKGQIGRAYGEEPQLYPKNKGVGRKTYVIKAENWDKNFPYLFTVLRAEKDTQSVINLASLEKGFQEFKLPINPANISISIPFATNVSATSRGILEEHNGTVFRNITIAGTTGVTPGLTRSGGYENTDFRGSAAARGAVELGTATGNALANTIQGFQRTLTAATGKLAALKSGTKAVNKWLFGHAQLHLLLNYFVAYTEHKKDPGNHLARLVFVSVKDNTAYICTPISFNVTKNSANPHQFDYNITLKAWDMVEGGADGKGLTQRNPFGFVSMSNNPSLLTRTFNTLKEARATISASRSAIKAVASDLERALSVVTQTMLIVKEAKGLKHDLADFPELVKTRWTALADIVNTESDFLQEDNTDSPSTQSQKNKDASFPRFQERAANTIEGADPTNKSGIPTANQTEEQKNATQQKLDVQNPFKSNDAVIDHIDFLALFPVERFVLTDAEEEEIERKMDSARGLSISDFDRMRREVESVRDAYADSRGLGDADYDDAAGRTEVAGIRRSPTSVDYQVIKAFNDVITVIDTISATNDFVKAQIPNPFARASAIVADSDISIAQANSAFPVPFPFNGTLEKLAARYLDDPDRWIEIALLNELKPPYIDEEGFIQSFTTSGANNSFTISDASNLYLDQEVFLSSVTQRLEKRRITNIDQIDDNSYLITVDGADDLGKLTVTHQARMKAYLPNTINSSKIILIPLPEVLPPNENAPDTREIPSTRNLTAQERLMGIDISLTEDFDIAITNNGDVRLSTGFNNAIQALRLKLAIEKSQLKHHPEYGSGLPIGERHEYSAADIKEFLEEAISSDPRFESLPDIMVELDGPAVKLNLRVRVVEDGGVIPITFTL